MRYLHFFLAKSRDLYLYFDIYSHVVIINKIDTEIEKMTLIFKICTIEFVLTPKKKLIYLQLLFMYFKMPTKKKYPKNFSQLIREC